MDKASGIVGQNVDLPFAVPQCDELVARGRYATGWKPGRQIGRRASRPHSTRPRAGLLGAWKMKAGYQVSAHGEFVRLSEVSVGV